MKVCIFITDNRCYTKGSMLKNFFAMSKSTLRMLLVGNVAARWPTTKMLSHIFNIDMINF